MSWSCFGRKRKWKSGNLDDGGGELDVLADLG